MTWVTALVIAQAIVARTARAADETPKKEFLPEKMPPADKLPQGWIPQINLNATTSLGDNRSVVGQPDGTTISIGLKFQAVAAYHHGKHEWRTALGIAAAMTKTPVLDEMIKSQDELGVESSYLYRWLPWLGPFVGMGLQAPMFRGANVTPVATDYLITRPDGSTDSVMTTRLALSDPLKPMILKQSAGPYARPVESEAFTLEMRAGAGAREMLGGGQLAVNDDKETSEVEVKELEDIYQGGIELVAGVAGELLSKRVSYRFGVDVMMPLAHSALPAGDTRNALDLTNIVLTGQVKVPLVQWAALNYELKAQRLPQLLDAFQVQNNLLLTVGVSYNPKGGKP